MEDVFALAQTAEKELAHMLNEHELHGELRGRVYCVHNISDTMIRYLRFYENDVKKSKRQS